MRIEITPNLTGAQKEIICRLWNAEYPAPLNYGGVDDFAAFLSKITDHRHFLLFDENENLGGWLLSFTRDDERWFSIIIDGRGQKKGAGTMLLNEVKKFENELSGWVVPNDELFKSNGERYLSPLGFYRKNGFAVLADVRLEKGEFQAVKIKWIG